jgi:hypothetical protein
MLPKKLFLSTLVDFVHDFIGDVKIGVDSLDIIVLFKSIQQI